MFGEDTCDNIISLNYRNELFRLRDAGFESYSRFYL